LILEYTSDPAQLSCLDCAETIYSVLYPPAACLAQQETRRRESPEEVRGMIPVTQKGGLAISLDTRGFSGKVDLNWNVR
jgi:hypothetical protein